nr:hypothetical protein BaRGS_008767 [Batillaria attramentaria]
MYRLSLFGDDFLCLRCEDAQTIMGHSKKTVMTAHATRKCVVVGFSANPLGTDRVYRVKHVEKFLQKNSTQITPQVLTESVVWPNEVTGVYGSAKGQLVWFQNENGLNQSTPWKSHVIAEGPDIFFESVPYVNTTEGYIQAIFVAQFFSPALKVFWVGTSGNWSDTSKINQRIIDKSIGQVFDVDFCDVNGDENMDLLVTANSATNGTVWAYEIPRDFRTGVYKRHLLASGFKSRSGEIGKGAPGSAQLIYTRQETGYKASILLSGDDAGQAFILNPRSEAKDDWTYTVTPFLDAGSGTVGGIDYADVDRDDHKEIFVNSRDIDMTIGPVFDVIITDVNGDFESDLLVTAHSASNGTVWAYEIPDDFRTGEYKRHLLASGFMSSSVHQGKGAPGSARPISHGTASGKDPIILSGDDSGQAYVLNARSNAKDDWSYTVTPFLDAGTGNVACDKVV